MLSYIFFFHLLTQYTAWINELRLVVHENNNHIRVVRVRGISTGDVVALLARFCTCPVMEKRDSRARKEYAV